MSYTIRTPKEISFSQDFHGKQITLKTWMMAPNSDGAVRVKIGQTEVLVTSVMNRSPNPDKDFLPLTIDFRDFNPAVGKIGGGPYRRREWRPTEMMTLYSRIVDRTLRPMFPKGMINDVVITITPMSFDRVEDLAILGILWWSVATILAWIPFDWPVSWMRVGANAGELIMDPNIDQFDNKDLNLLVSWKRWSINMIEMDGLEIDESLIEKAFVVGQQAIDDLCVIQTEFLKLVDTALLWSEPRLTKYAKYNYPSDQLKSEIKNHIITHDKLEKLYEWSKEQWFENFHLWKEELKVFIDVKLKDDSIEDKSIYTPQKASMTMDLLVREYFRELILDKNIRIDWRKLDQIRALFAETWLLDQVHGSALFWRWDTQILNTVTLWAPWDVQLVDDMMNDASEKRFMHHYNFPPFSVNEAQRIRWTWNREIGHGRLAEKALEPMIPNKLDFPYTIRLVSDCLGSGGSTSMGSVCASTLSLMDAWVPLIRPVSGIAMGLCSRTNEQWLTSDYQILTDIQGAEDHHCDMDFKVAGTPVWITAIQLDMKIRWITVIQAMEVIKRANIWRAEILEYMLTVKDKPNEDLKPTAPRITVIKIEAEKVKLVIGKWWETIDKIIAETWVKIDFEDDGTCMITSKDSVMIQRTIELIMWIVYEPKIGDEFTGKITRIESYGLFVNYHGKLSGLVGSRTLWAAFGPDLKVHFKEWQEIKVKVTKVEAGKVDLMKL